MIELKDVSKSFQTGQYELTALNQINLTFRPEEFVAVVGESGSGKTTLLNIIGGLLSYDQGELLIHGRPSSSFSETDWDAYRNNSVGFIFQNYQLIPHLSVLANVEMGMTLSNKSKADRREKAATLLERVGLANHLHKRPHQLSGGQMQRVAIARALANDPDIILADEPTGALDNETSKEILDLLAEISRDKLIVMVTHSLDQAEAYADRLIQVKDGQLLADSHPYQAESAGSNYQLNKTKMSFWNALKLSWQNILTKKVRTSLTAFAASIGIFGVALILALSNGLNQQIESFETDSLAQYPLMIQDQALALGHIQNQENSLESLFEDMEKYPDSSNIFPGPLLNTMEELEFSNQITADLMDYIQSIPSDQLQAVQYKRPVKLNVLAENDGQVEEVDLSQYGQAMPFSPSDDPLKFIKKQYDLLSGDWPQAKEDLVLILNEYNQVDQKVLDSLAIDYDPDQNLDFDQVLGKPYRLISNDDYYKKEEDLYQAAQTEEELKQLYQKADHLDLSIVGIIRPKEESSKQEDLGGLYYTDDLLKSFIQDASRSQIVQDQEESSRNLLTGRDFNQQADLSQANLSIQMGGQASGADPANPALIGSKDELLSYLGQDKLAEEISIYPESFESKQQIKDYLNRWNEKVDREEEQIVLTDLAQLITELSGGLMNAITLVLVAFASISLLVSMLMIGIIIYISVVERTQEIGVLRALGARAKDISRVFNAESLIIGWSAGLIGIGLAYLLTLPINSFISSLTGLDQVANLSAWHALALVILSLILTLIAGLIPSRMAAKKDPVQALSGE